MTITARWKSLMSQRLLIILFGALLVLPGVGYGEVDREMPPGAPSVFVIAIGINDYPNQPLQYARADAIAISEAIEKACPEARIHKYVVLDEQATRDHIAAAFEKVIAAIRPDDIFVFHFSGYHSFATDERSNREFYLLPAGLLFGEESEEILSSKAIPASLLKSWVARIQADKQLLILDTCYAEKVVTAFKEAVKSEGTQALQLSGKKIMILGPEELAFEASALGHGWLTFALLKGFSGEADAWPKDRAITAGELEVYLRGQALRPHGWKNAIRIASATIGQDFEIVRLPGYRGVRVVAEEEQTPKPSPGKDYALLIATDRYDSWQPLGNPVHDAQAIAEDLHEIYGFETECVENPTQDQFMDVLDEYLDKDKLSSNDQLLIFIAGHGFYNEMTREGFLIAKDSKASREDNHQTTFISLTRVRDIVDLFPAKSVFVVIDSCFGGTFDQRIAYSGQRGGDEYTEVSALEFKMRKMKYKSRRYLTSGGKEYVPDGRPGQYSPFARKVLEALRSYGGKEGYLTIGKILQYVEKVSPEPRAGEFGHHEPGGDFVLIKK